MKTLCAGCGKTTNNTSMCEACLAAAEDHACPWPDPACCPQCGTAPLIQGQTICQSCLEGNLEDLQAIDTLIEAGHKRHCAERQVYGDGECECDLYENGYSPYSWATGIVVPTRERC